MPNTSTIIASGNFSGGGATISGIPATYDDLLLVTSTRDTYASTGSNFVRIRFNSDAGTNYSMTQVFNTGTATGSNQTSNDTVGYCAWINYGNNTAGAFSSSSTYFPNYSRTAVNKTWTFESAPDWNQASIYCNILGTGLWRSTAAINRMDFFPVSSFDPLSTFTLYGIKYT